MVYEQRIYHAMPGRLPDVLKRFETLTLPIFERLGIRQAGFWTYLVGGSQNDLVYMLAWESMAERETKWATFQADPEWLAKRPETERDGPIVASVENAFLQSTRFSALR